MAAGADNRRARSYTARRFAATYAHPGDALALEAATQLQRAERQLALTREYRGRQPPREPLPANVIPLQGEDK
jgi:hypothetical protein